MTKKLHIAIATKQPLANLLPLLDDPPELLWLLVSNDMNQAAAEFINFINKVPALAGTTVVQKKGLPDSPYLDIESFGLDLAAELEEHYSGWHKTYNVTGGTKLMAVALTGIFKEDSFSQLYVNTASNQIEQLYPHKESKTLAHMLNTRIYLEAHDVTWRKADSDSEDWKAQIEHRQAATRKLANAIAKESKANDFLSMLNQQLAKALTADKKLVQPQIDLSFIPPQFKEALSKLAEADIIDIELNNKRLYLKSIASHRYLSGGWLEEYFYLTAKKVGLTDIHSGIHITDNFDSKKDIRNELDSALSHANRLLLVECKTSAFGKDQQKDSNIVYKLDSLAHQIGGIFHTPLLLSAQPLDHTTSKNRQVFTTARANAADIHVLAGADIIKLEDALKWWMMHGKWMY